MCNCNQVRVEVDASIPETTTTYAHGPVSCNVTNCPSCRPRCQCHCRCCACARGCGVYHPVPTFVPYGPYWGVQPYWSPTVTWSTVCGMAEASPITTRCRGSEGA